MTSTRRLVITDKVRYGGWPKDGRPTFQQGGGLVRKTVYENKQLFNLNGIIFCKKFTIT